MRRSDIRFILKIGLCNSKETPIKEQLVFDDLIGELIHLRKGKGITPSKIRSAYHVTQLLSDNENESTDNYVALLRSALNTLPDQEGAKSLLSAFALLPECAEFVLLSERRDWYGSQIHLKRDAVADIENAAIKELAIELINIYYNRARIAEIMPCRRDTVVQESVSVKVFIKDGRWVRTDEHYCLVLLEDGLRQLEFESAFPATIATLDQSICHAETREDKLHHVVHLKQALKRSSLIDIAFSLLPDFSTIDDNCIDIAFRAQFVTTLHCEYEVAFEGRYPTDIWCFSQVEKCDRHNKPDKQEHLALKSDGVAKAAFFELHSGLYSGIAWEW